MQGVIKKEEIAVLAHLFDSIDEALNHLDEAIKDGDSIKVDKVKKEILSLQSEVAKRL